MSVTRLISSYIWPIIISYTVYDLLLRVYIRVIKGLFSYILVYKYIPYVCYSYISYIYTIYPISPIITLLLTLYILYTLL